MTEVDDADGNDQDLGDAGAPPITMLDGWLALNQRDPDGQTPAARSLLYSDVPRYFWWRNRRWTRRQRDLGTVSRMYIAHPSQGERFYVRLMLLHVRGAQSWQDLRSVNGAYTQKMLLTVSKMQASFMQRIKRRLRRWGSLTPTTNGRKSWTRLCQYMVDV